MKAAIALAGLATVACGAVPPATPAGRESTAPSAVIASPLAGADQLALDATPRGSRAEERAARRAARSFASAYLAFTYRRDDGHLRHAHAAPTLVAALIAAPPDVPTAVRGRRPRILHIALSWLGPRRVSALVTVDDGVTSYPVALELDRDDAGFVVRGLEP